MIQKTLNPLPASPETPSPGGARLPSRPVGPIVLLGILIPATVAALLLGNGNPLVALAPILAFMLLYALIRLPLRVPVFALLAAGLMFEAPSDAMSDGKWESPWRIIGAVLFAQLKNTFSLGGLGILSGCDFVIVFLLGLHVYRRAVGSTIDKAGFEPLPRPSLYACWASLSACIFSLALGMALGGEFRFAQWQIQRLIYLPAVFLLVQAALPHAGHYRTLGRLIVGCACFRAVVAIYVRSLFPDAEFTTTHHDSMLFAVASFILIIGMLEVRSRQALINCLVLFPLLFWGIVANDRRLAYVELGLALVSVLIFSRRSKVKLKLLRSIIIATPILLGYVAAGWSSKAGIFAPVATIRSVVDSGSDTSTLWRDFENVNLVATVSHHPIFGTGLGHPFDLVVPFYMHVYELEPYAPHNSMLGLWAYNGYVGFIGHWMPLIVCVYFSMRVYRFASDARHRAAGLACYAAVVIYMVHLYGDMALGTWTSVMLMSSAMVMAGKLAVAAGAWPRTASRARARS